ncbi:hypothetical protein FOZ63_026885 [Perkinsus olseni]|uniref:RING-type domain-containing protein n=1 Tax=Perkinsus olseni TaxID=32597 RepID=A0A7J6Q581_PEROL|nr:hypothetical protein FOZ63_026885 [Perkinsus olseni]
MASDLIPAILGIVIAAQLILLSFIIYRLQKSRMSSRPPSSTNSGAVHVLHGKTMTYEAKMAPHTNDEDPAKSTAFQSCTICLSPYDLSEMVMELGCGHFYHDDCIRKWFNEAPNHQCPYCRTSCGAPPNEEDGKLSSDETASCASSMPYYYR